MENNVTVLIGDKAYKIQLTQEQEQEIKQQRYTQGYVRVDKADDYYIVDLQNTQGVITVTESESATDELNYSYANYYSNEEKATQAYARTVLKQKLMCYAVLNNRQTKGFPQYTIVYDAVKCLFRPQKCEQYVFGCVYFDTEETAANAIELFAEDLAKSMF